MLRYGFLILTLNDMGLFNIKLGKKTTEKAVDVIGDVTKGITKGLDVLAFTKEERAELNFKIGEQVTNFVKMTMEESTARSKTRRYIAITFIYLFALLLVAGAVAFKFDKEFSEFLLSLAREQSNIVLSIVLFYFGYYGLQKIIPEKKK